MAKKFEALIEPKKFNYKDIEYHVGKIPAFYAQRLLMRSTAALNAGDMSQLPEDVLVELLSYVAIVNQHGVPIVIEDIDTANVMLGHDCCALIAIEMKVVEENFGFFFDGSLREIFEPMVKRLAGTAS